MRPVVKILVLLLAVGAVGGGIGLLVLGSGWVNPYLRDYAEGRLSRRLGMAVEIGSLQGNPLAGLRMDRVRLGEGPEPLLVLDALDVQYRLLGLLWGAVIVDTLRFRAPRVRFREATGGADWAAGVLAAADPDRWTGGPEWKIHIGHAEVVDGGYLWGTEGRVDSLNVVVGFQAGPKGYELALRRFRSLLFDPPLVIRNLAGLTLLRDGQLVLKGLRLHTPGSHLQIDGTMTGLSRPEYDFALRADSLAFGEMARIFPGTYPRGSVAVEGRAWGDASGMRGDFRFNYGSTTCAVSGRVDFTGEGVVYDVQAEGRGVDLAQIGPQWSLDARFDTVIRLQGRGLDALTAEGTVSAGMARAYLFGTAVDTANLVAALKGGQVVMDLRAEGEAGGLAANLEVDLRGAAPVYALRARLANLDLSRVSGASGRVTDLTGEVRLRRTGAGMWQGEARFDALNIQGLPPATGLVLRGSSRGGRVRLDSLGVRLPDGYGVVRGKGRMDLGQFWRPGGKQPTYQMGLQLEGLALERLTGDARLGGDVSFQISLAGAGFHPDSMQARADLVVEAPDFLGGELDSARASLVLQGRRVILDRLMLAGALMRFDGRGWATPGDSLDIHVTGQVHDFEALSNLLGLGLSGTPAPFVVRVGGSWEKPLAAVDLLADSLNYQGIPMQRVTFQMRWPALLPGGLSVRVGSLVWGGRVVHDLFLDVGLDGDGISFLLGNSSEDIDRVYLWGRAGPWEGGYYLELDSLAVQVDRMALFNDGPCRVRYSPQEGVHVEQFRLAGAGGGIEARDHSGQPGAVVVWLQDVDLRTWSFLLGLRGEMSGVLTGEITLSGTPDDPQIGAQVELKNGAVAGVRFQDFSGTLAYGNRRAAVDLKLVQSPGREAVLQGYFPLNLSPGGREDLFPEGPVSVLLRADGIDPGFLQAVFSEVRDTGGMLAMDLSVEGTPRRLRLQEGGWIRLQDGVVRIVPLNKTFRKVQAKLSFAEDRIVLEQLEAREGKGRLAFSGEVRLDQHAVEGFGVQDFDIALQAEDFEAINLPELNATLRADLHLRGNPEASRVEGKAGLTRAVLRLSDFIETPTHDFWVTSRFIQNLGCNIRVSASRNVWIRDRDLNIEISGDVDLVKDREGVRIYGALDSRQGRYEFQNTSFNIDRGELQFQGNADINPDLYILGTHRVILVSNEPAVISVIVGGTLLNPQITLESDTTPPLSEADLLSYLIVGRPAEEMSGFLRGEGGGGRSLEGQAAGLVLGVAANQLKRTIGRRLNLDVVEIDLGRENSATRVRVGKYFGSRFFISYAQDISSARGQEVIVEYELLPQVTLEAQQRVGNEQERDRKSLGLFWKMEW